jgi:hypothetical protein
MASTTQSRVPHGSQSRSNFRQNRRIRFADRRMFMSMTLAWKFARIGERRSVLFHIFLSRCIRSVCSTRCRCLGISCFISGWRRRAIMQNSGPQNCLRDDVAEAVMFPSPAAFHSYFPFQMPRCAYVASDIRTIISPGYPSTVILGFSIHVPDSPRVHGSPR